MIDLYTTSYSEGMITLEPYETKVYQMWDDSRLWEVSSKNAVGILEMEYRIPIIRYRGQKMPYELFRTSYFHNSTQYSHIVKLTLHFYAHIGAGH